MKKIQRSFETINDVELVSEEIDDPKNWDKSFDFKPKDSIEKLIDYINEKKQETKAIVQKLKECLETRESAKTIFDLMNWGKEDYQRLNIKTTWIYEIQEVVEMVKDMNNEDSSSSKKLKA